MNNEWPKIRLTLVRIRNLLVSLTLRRNILGASPQFTAFLLLEKRNDGIDGLANQFVLFVAP